MRAFRFLALGLVLVPGSILMAAVDLAPAPAPPSAPSAPAPAPAAPPPAPAPSQVAPEGQTSEISETGAGDEAEAPSRPQPPPEVLKQIERDKAADDRARQLRAAATAHPDEVSYQVAWINGLLDLGRNEEALSSAPDLVAKFPRSGELTTALGRVYLRDGQFDLAAVQFQRSLALDANSARTHALAGKTALIVGDAKLAEAELRRAVAIDKSDPEPRSALALLLERSGRYAEALEMLGGATPKEGTAPLSGRRSLLPALAKNPPMVIPSKFTSVTVPFVLAKGFPPFVKVKLGPTLEKYLVIDTASDDSSITSETARALGGPEKGAGTQKDEEGHEHSTPAWMIVDTISLGDLTVGRLPVRATPGLRYPDERIAGTLGRDFLRRFRVTLDYKAKTLTLAKPDGAPLAGGSPFYLTSALLVGGFRGDRSVGKFVLDSSSYTPGVLDAQFVSAETGLTIFSEEVKKINQGPYLFKFTMPDLTIAGVRFAKFPATAVDLRMMSRQLGVNINGVIGLSLLHLCKVEIDFKSQTIAMIRTAPEPAGNGEPASPAPTEPGT